MLQDAIEGLRGPNSSSSSSSVVVVDVLLFVQLVDGISLLAESLPPGVSGDIMSSPQLTSLFSQHFGALAQLESVGVGESLSRVLYAYALVDNAIIPPETLRRVGASVTDAICSGGGRGDCSCDLLDYRLWPGIVAALVKTAALLLVVVA